MEGCENWVFEEFDGIDILNVLSDFVWFEIEFMRVSMVVFLVLCGEGMLFF